MALTKPFPIQKADIFFGADVVYELLEDIFSEGVLTDADLKITPRSTPALAVLAATGRGYVTFGTPDGGVRQIINDAEEDSGTPGSPNTTGGWISTFTVADGTDPRIDRVVVTIRDGNVDGGANFDAVFQVIAGTPTAGATLVNLLGAAAVPSNSILLANVLIGAGATTITASEIDTTFGSPRPQTRIGQGNAAGGSPNFVTSLPSSPQDEDEVVYEADASEGVYWHLKFDASESHWGLVGGGWLEAVVETAESTASAGYTDLATVGPSLTVPEDGTYDVEINSRIDGSVNNWSGAMSYDVGASAADDTDSAEEGGPATAIGSGHSIRRQASMSASDVFTSKYKNPAGGAPTFENRVIRIRPVFLT